MATTDWGKLKVVDLKAELKRRGLPQAGRKDELISRLAEADASQGDPQQESVTGDAVQLAEATEQVEEEFVAPPQESSKVPQGQESQEPEASPPKADLPPSFKQQQQPAAPIQSPPSRQESPARPSPEAAAAITPLPIVTPSEAMADTQKRKRRSRSPPPTAHDVQHKRMRIDGESSAAASPPKEMPHANGVMEARRTPEPTPAPRDDLYGEQVQVDYGADSPRTSPAVAKIQQMTPEPPGPTLEKESQYDHKSGRDNNHDSGLSQPKVVEEEKDKVKEEELHQQVKLVEPSIHPPTSALYIKNFMRPLRAPMVEEHLIRLATAPGSSPDESLVEDFYLDQIRTHAFVLFKSTVAASKVRAALHNQVWPDESLRKALWVDFVPPDKVRGWIEREQAGGGRRGSMNRWEVVYENMGDKVETSLQEPGAESKPARPPPSAAPPAPPHHMDGPAAPPRQYPGIESAPSGPKGFVHPARMVNIDGLDRGANTANNLDRRSSGFQDHLPTTRATPRVTYQPVSEDLARRRLDNMRSYFAPDANSRDLGRENNRYTFEAGHQFVDRGREIFEGIRPPHRERERREQERRRGAGSGGGGGGGPPYRPPPGRFGGGGGGRPPRNDYRPPPRSNDFRPDRPPRYNSYGGGRR